MKISAALIVKNEEVLLARCLESLKGLDEIVIVDTGSTDKTIEIAKRYTDKVFTDFTWCDNFAKARNHVKSKATGDWILSIDADEVLHNVDKVREAVALAEQRQVLTVDVECIASDNGQSFNFPRLFKNVPNVFWEGAIHNTLSVSGTKVGDVKIQIGYSPAHANDPDRAYRILLKEVKDAEMRNQPPSPRMLFYLGREYFYKGDYENCVQTMGAYVKVSNFKAERADAFLAMARAYWAMKMSEDAKDACIQALKINSNFKEAAKFMADLVRKDVSTPNWQENVKRWEEMAEKGDNKEVLFMRRLE